VDNKGTIKEGDTSILGKSPISTVGVHTNGLVYQEKKKALSALAGLFLFVFSGLCNGTETDNRIREYAGEIR